jgi:gamma-glutamyltranspeptidase/glutathione hydrolase
MSETTIPLGAMLMMTLVGAGADRPTKNPKATRSVVMATDGMVATSHPLAVQAGVDILKRGGNAIDAAVAVNAVLGVVEPMSCGIGGDLFAIVWDAKSGRLYGLNASGRSPYAATRDYFAKRGLKEIPETGPLSWSVPGCVDGWDQLLRRFGSKPLAEVLTPAIEYATGGFPVTEIIGGSWRSSERLLQATPDAAKTYLQNNKAPRIGERMTNRYLAQTYRLLAKDGRDAFYKGPIARQLVEFSEQVGGLFTTRDFAEHSTTWVEPVSTTYRGRQVWELPPNGQGIAVLQMLNILESFDIRKIGHNSPEFLHLFIEAKKLAFADRARFYADPQVERHLPIAELISKEYADRQRKRIDPNRAALAVPPGDPRYSRADTVYVAIVDKDRNAVSFIQSIYYGWGSGLVPGNLGFALQNRGALFALDPNHPNRLEPHKRPFHTIIPAMVTDNGKPWFVFGVMGGDMQPQGHVQVLVNLIDHGMNVQEAGEAARCQHFGSSTPTGSVMTDGGQTLSESGIPDATLEALRKKGHRVGRGAAFGGYQGILIDHQAGILHGGSDPRKDGCAMGY